MNLINIEKTSSLYPSLHKPCYDMELGTGKLGTCLYSGLYKQVISNEIRAGLIGRTSPRVAWSSWALRSEKFVSMTLRQWSSNRGNQTKEPASVERGSRGWDRGVRVRER